MKGLWITISFCLLLAACASNYHQAIPDEAGFLPIGNDADVRITVNRGVDTSQYRKTLYVSTDMHGVVDWYGYQDYIMEAFRQLDFFDQVVTRQPTIYMNATPPTAAKQFNDKTFWLDMTDPVSNRDILKQYGPNVLIAKSILRNRSQDYGERGGFYYQLQIIDPTTSLVIWQGSKTGGNTLGVDMNLINPVLNYFKGYLVAYDPHYVPQHPPERGLAEMITGQESVTPYSYQEGLKK